MGAADAEPTAAMEEEAMDDEEEEATDDEAMADDAMDGEGVNMVLLPKFLGILVFDQAHQGAMEAHEEVGNSGELQFLGPTPERTVSTARSKS